MTFSMRRFMTTAAVTAALLAGAVGVSTGTATAGTGSPSALVTARPASASALAPAKTLCPSGWFCVWHGAPRSSGWLGGNKHHVCFTPFNNNGNAVSDQIGRNIRVFSSPGCKGGSHFDLTTGHFRYPTPFTVRSVLTF